MIMESNTAAKPKRSQISLFILAMLVGVLGMVFLVFGTLILIPILGEGPIVLLVGGLVLLAAGYLMNPLKEETV
jgi:hypothetical protein